MPYDNSKAAVATRPELLPGADDRPLVALRLCLVVSTHPGRRELLRRAAAEGGWLPIVCGDAETALAESRRLATPLVLVDLYDRDGRRDSDCGRLVEQLAAQPDRLLAVCGGDADPLEETWVRQLGAWMFLPGIGEESDLTHVCSEARYVVERLAASEPPAPHARRANRRSGPRQHRG
jgi:hypothetical protein